MLPAIPWRRAWRVLLTFLHPPIRAEDPQERFRLRALRVMGQVTSAAVFIPALVLLADVASRPSPLYLLITGACALGTMLITLALLLWRAAWASYFVVPAVFLLPMVSVVLGLTVELLYPTMMFILYADVLLPRWGSLTLHAVHLGFVTCMLAFSDTYTLFPVDGDVNTTHYFSTYLILYAIATVYSVNFHAHLREVTGELASRNEALAHANEGLSQQLVERLEQLFTKEAQLAQHRRAEALATVTGGVAHDINNLLHAIRVSSDLLRARMERSPVQEEPGTREIMSRLQNAVRRGEALIRRMFGVVLQEPLETEIVAVRELYDAVVEFVRPDQPAHIRIVVDMPDDGLWIAVDRAQVEAALTNLVTNGLHAIGSSPGEVRLEARRGAGSRILLRVRDSGPGIPAELVERIFEPFFTTKPRGIGLGLGLPQVRRVVEEHSGVLSIETAAGAGATFELSFAASAPPSAASSEIAPPPPPPVLLHGPRVLLVEDEEDIAQLIREALTTVRLEHCASVVAAVKAIGEATVPFDVMLLDMNLSGGSSRAVFRAARARWPRLPIIVTTGWAPEEELRALLAEPHTHYLRKPFGVSDLRGQVARACERSGPLAVATSSEPA